MGACMFGWARSPGPLLPTSAGCLDAATRGLRRSLLAMAPGSRLRGMTDTVPEPQPQKPASDKPTSPTSVRFEPEEHAVVDAMAEDLDCKSRSDALRAVVRAWAKSPEVREFVREAAFVRLPQLPRVMRYRVVAPFKKLVGTFEVELKRGQVVTLDGHAYDFLADLYRRGALLQPLP